MNVDLFGNQIVEKNDLKSEFLIPPFSILDSASGDWQKRKLRWKRLGIESELGRDATTFNMKDWADNKAENLNGHKLPSDTSIFDPVLCELMYHWFVPKFGKILDPFAGGSVRGIVANYSNFNYSGIDLSKKQIDANIEQGKEICTDVQQPKWIYGDSNEILDTINERFDFIFSCPPYYDLEVYSKDPRDISSLSKEQFDVIYEQIIKKSCDLLSNNRYACFVVGNCRDKNGFMMDLVGKTIQSFEKAGARFYNEIILKNSNASGSLRAAGNMKYKKIVKMHQNVLVFCKGDPKQVPK